MRAAERRKLAGDSSGGDKSGSKHRADNNNAGSDNTGDVCNLLSDEEDDEDETSTITSSSTSSIVPVEVSLQDADLSHTGANTTGVHAILWTAQGKPCPPSSSSRVSDGAAAAREEEGPRVPLLDMTRCRGCKR